MNGNGAYYGKYRGTVVSNIDPLNTGRLQLRVPDVLGDGLSSWAMPCVPFSGRQMGMWALPQVGAGVWVEFEKGDPDYPIWSGCWWGSAAEPPSLALAAPPANPNLVIQTAGQATLMLSDVPGPAGGILLRTKSGAMISINDAGITISNGQGALIEMRGPAVKINGTALVVT